jgi:tetratricopeptide (TPR) repeat protein
MLVRRTIGEENFAKARELVLAGDYYGAIVLLRQTVHYSPEHADAWLLLGTCQQRNPNPKWQRDAMDSIQRAIAANPNLVEAILTLGDLYRSTGLSSRARACYDDVLSIDPENGEAKVRLKSLK